VDKAYADNAEIHATPRGRLRLALPRVAAEKLVCPRLPDFLRLNPLIDIELSVGNRFSGLISEGFDAGIRRSHAFQASVATTRLTADDHLVLMTSPGFSAATGVPTHPDDLLSRTSIRLKRLSSGTLSPWILRRRGEQIAIHPARSLLVDDARMALDMAFAGTGIARLARSYVEGHVRDDRLRLVMAGSEVLLGGHFIYFRRELLRMVR
jgi:DNA-binding transcriptional LysR family regulator